MRNLRFRAHRHWCWTELIHASSSNSVRCGSSSFRSGQRFLHRHARVPKTGSSRCGSIRYGWAMPAPSCWPTMEYLSKSACCCSTLRRFASRHDFHTHSRQSSLPLPHHCSLPARVRTFRRSASRFRHSSHPEIQHPQLFVPPLLHLRRDSAASTAADATSVAGMTVGAMCFAFLRNAASFRCESWIEPPRARWRTGWHAWARQANCRSSCEPNSTVRESPPSPWFDLPQSVPLPRLRAPFRHADR